MAFEFRFDRMMRINENEKQILERQYNEMYQHLEKQAKKLIELMQKKDMLQNRLEKIKQEKVMVSDVIDMTRVLSRLSDHIIEEQHRYNQIKIRVEKFRQKLLEKSIELKKFEKLKVMKKQHYDWQEKQRESFIMDEKAMINYLRH